MSCCFVILQAGHLFMASFIILLRRWILALLALIVFGYIVRSFFVAPSPPLVPEPQGIIPPTFRKELVVASLRDDDTSWLQKNLPDWKANIYVVNNKAAPLTVPVNKGREAMVYLTFIINNYKNLPDVMVFMHSLRYQWHNDDPIYDGVPMLQNLQLPYIMSDGYVSLRCVWTLGCPSEIQVHKENSEMATEAAYPEAFQELFPGQPLPDVVGVACCAQFAVTKAKVRERPLADYEHYRNWLSQTRLPDETSGRVLEYAWHIVFGKPAVHCPNAAECYCRTFGLCNLKCGVNKCGERWAYPPFATLPKGWPQVGWNGEVRSEEEIAAMRNVSNL